MTGVSIYSSSSIANTCAGSLVARAINTSFTNCHATGNITTTGANSGGLIGWLQLNSTVKDSQAGVSVASGDSSYSGGLVGHMFNASLSDCYATGSVTGSNCSAGGLTGFAESTNMITNCYAAGNVVAGSHAYSGGLVGWGGSQITNCYTTGNVTGGSRVGGLVGYSNGASIINAYATGNLSGTDGNAAVGDLVGFGSVTINDGYGETNPAFPVNTEEMKSGTFVAILNSNASSLSNDALLSWISVSNINNGYPLLNGVGDGSNQSDAEVPVITNHPGDISVSQGNIASLSVSAGGTGTLSYQWFHNDIDSNHHGILIPGATGPTYTVPTSALGTTYYYCAVINTRSTSGVHTVATEMSEAAGVEVIAPSNAETPIITTNPTGITVMKGDPASLSVTATVSSGSLSYQWYSNTIDHNSGGTIITGATDFTYAVQTSTIGTSYYYCVVTNNDPSATGTKIATATSQTAAVTVTSAPVAAVEVEVEVEAEAVIVAVPLLPARW